MRQKIKLSQILNLVPGARQDMKSHQVKENPSTSLFNRNVKSSYQYIDCDHQAKLAIQQLDQIQILGLDLETEGLNYRTDSIRLIQIACPESVFIFDLKHLQSNYKDKFSRLFRSEKTLIMHNVIFDLAMLKQAGFRVECQNFCNRRKFPDYSKKCPGKCKIQRNPGRALFEKPFSGT